MCLGLAVQVRKKFFFLFFLFLFFFYINIYYLLGGVQVGVNYRLKKSDVHYIFDHAGVECIFADKEFVHLLQGFNQKVKVIVDLDNAEGKGEFEDVIKQGWEYDSSVNGGTSLRWDGLQLEPESEDDLIALAYTSGVSFFFFF